MLFNRRNTYFRFFHCSEESPEAYALLYQGDKELAYPVTDLSPEEVKYLEVISEGARDYQKRYLAGKMEIKKEGSDDR